MDYNEILSKIKKVFIEKLTEIVDEDAYKTNPKLTKFAYLDSLYTDIMALGYNFGDLQKAADDIYEMKSALHGESNELYNKIKFNVRETSIVYPGLVKIFSLFHTKTQAGEDFDKVLNDIKLAIKGVTKVMAPKNHVKYSDLNIEQKVHRLILQKLYVKVDDSKIFIDKQTFIEIMLKDIIALAVNNYDIDKAVKYRSKQYGKGVKSKDELMVELQQIIDEFISELDAYIAYLDCLEQGVDEEEILDIVNNTLNIDSEFFQKKMHQLMIQSMEPKIDDEDAIATGYPKEQILNLIANNIRFIACNDTIEAAVEEAFLEYENDLDSPRVIKKNIYSEFKRIQPICANEIMAYKMAMDMHNQNAEMAAVFAFVRQMLDLE
ncbi:MAG: hypothetical protein U0W24_20830 [Bacteroidales bacterium]